MAGKISTDSRLSMLLWVSRSKLLRESISVPKSSARYGSSASGGNTSRMPPRTENCPLAETMSQRS